MSAVWYSHKNLKPQGPFTLEQMRAKIHSGEIGPNDLICHIDEDRWHPAHECREFEPGLFPAAQEFNPGAEIDFESPDWVLLVFDEAGSPRQEGPLNVKEILLQVQQGRVSPNQYIWKTGLSGWVKIIDRPEFQKPISPTL